MFLKPIFINKVGGWVQTMLNKSTKVNIFKSAFLYLEYIFFDLPQAKRCLRIFSFEQEKSKRIYKSLREK